MSLCLQAQLTQMHTKRKVYLKPANISGIFKENLKDFYQTASDKIRNWLAIAKRIAAVVIVVHLLLQEAFWSKLLLMDIPPQSIMLMAFTAVISSN